MYYLTDFFPPIQLSIVSADDMIQSFMPITKLEMLKYTAALILNRKDEYEF